MLYTVILTNKHRTTPNITTRSNACHSTDIDIRVNQKASLVLLFHPINLFLLLSKTFFSLRQQRCDYAMAAESNGGVEVEVVLPRSGHITVAAENYMITWGGYQVQS